MNEEEFIREMNDQDMDNDQYDDTYEVDIDYTTQSWDQTNYSRYTWRLNNLRRLRLNQWENITMYTYSDETLHTIHRHCISVYDIDKNNTKDW